MLRTLNFVKRCVRDWSGHILPLKDLSVANFVLNIPKTQRVEYIFPKSIPKIGHIWEGLFALHFRHYLPRLGFNRFSPTYSTYDELREQDR